MKKLSKLLAIMLAMVCLCTLVVPASAANVVKVVDADEFGTLTGTLYDSFAELYSFTGGNEVLRYGFVYETTVTRSPAEWATIHANVELYNKATGELIYPENNHKTCEDGNLRCGYDIQLDHIPEMRGTNGITVTVFGCHEVRYYDSYVAYTKKNYNLQRDHGII